MVPKPPVAGGGAPNSPVEGAGAVWPNVDPPPCSTENGKKTESKSDEKWIEIEFGKINSEHFQQVRTTSYFPRVRLRVLSMTLF